MIKFLVVAIVVALLILIAPVLLMYWGWSASILWGWFAVPLGAKALTAFQCGSIILLLGVFRNSHVPSNGQKGEQIEKITFVMVAPLSALAVGWLLRHWFGA